MRSEVAPHLGGTFFVRGGQGAMSPSKTFIAISLFWLAGCMSASAPRAPAHSIDSHPRPFLLFKDQSECFVSCISPRRCMETRIGTICALQCSTSSDCPESTGCRCLPGTEKQCYASSARNSFRFCGGAAPRVPRDFFVRSPGTGGIPEARREDENPTEDSPPTDEELAGDVQRALELLEGSDTSPKKQ